MIPTEGATVIGRETKFRGEISGSTDLIIDGDVEGTIRLTGAKLTVRPEGRVKATVTAQDVAIAGHLAGEIRATGRVELRDGAVVLGDVCAKSLSIEDGATLRGGVDPTRAAEPFPGNSAHTGNA
jgi:cytoskeletal protein CcmA (bactofilin family)